MRWDFWPFKDDSPTALMQEELELMVKAGRRCMHDLDHAACDLSVYNRAASTLWSERAALWRGVFYPGRDQKNYRSRLHSEIDRLADELARMRKLCDEHGVDWTSGADIPF